VFVRVPSTKLTMYSSSMRAALSISEKKNARIDRGTKTSTKLFRPTNSVRKRSAIQNESRWSRLKRKVTTISTARAESDIDLAATHDLLEIIENAIQKATSKHNDFLGELGLAPLPLPGSDSAKE
jgi:hypothetical protein